MPDTEILALARTPALLLQTLQPHYTVHAGLSEDSAAFATVAPRIRALVGGGESQVPRALLARLPALEIVSIMGVGYDGVDVPAALERGIAVTHTPGVLDDDVADLAIGLLLAVARRIPQSDRYVRAGRWLEGPMPLTRKVSGGRLGLVGLGRIGQAIASRAQAFGMRIGYHTRSVRPALPYTHFPRLRDLAAASDFLVVITPGGAATRHLIDAEVLKALGPQGVLINVARGSVVDETALIAALRDGTIAAAGLDVFADEPRVPEALCALDNVVLTPHVASATDQTRRAMADLAAANLAARLAGAPLPSAVPEWLAAQEI